MEDRVVRALELAASGAWEEAMTALDGVAEPAAAELVNFLDRLQRYDERRRELGRAIRHDVGNLLTIAQANVEGMLDGVVEPTLDRLEGIRDALATASERLQELALLRKERTWPS
jgi:signal transduction histidine kinase